MYEITDLSAPLGNGAAQSTAWRVNAKGQIAGFVYQPPPNPQLGAFLLTPIGSGLSVAGLDAQNSLPFDLNDAGQVVGDLWSDSQEFREAFLWNPATSANSSLDLPGVDREAFGINASGQVVGYYEYGDQSAHLAYLWNPDGTRTDLPPLIPGTSSEAHAINARGHVVGRSGAQPGVDEVGQAVVWHPQSDGTYSVEALDAPSGWISVAVAINDHGRIAGWGYDQRAGYEYARALYWPGDTGSASVADLGALDALGLQSSVTRGINAGGEIVGYASDRSGVTKRAFLYRGGSLIDLTGQISANSGWVLEEANGIADDGRIVGTGRFGGSERAFLLTPIVVPHHETLADELRRIVIAELSYLLYGLRNDSPGAVISPGGPPVPVPPGPVWQSLSASTKEVLLGLTVNQLATLVQDAAARRELQRAALRLVQAEVQRQLRGLE